MHKFIYFRINVGGKLLTNHLKEIISYRYTTCDVILIVARYSLAVVRFQPFGLNYVRKCMAQAVRSLTGNKKTGC